MTSTISAAVQQQLERRAKHKLAVLRHVEEVSGTVSATCWDLNAAKQSHDLVMTALDRSHITGNHPDARTLPLPSK